MRNNKGQFTAGHGGTRKAAVGTVRIRVRHSRGGVQRAYIKVAEPNRWKLLARHVWECSRGAIPSGWAIHHKDGDTLNDNLDNLELVTKATHLERHRAEYLPRTNAALVALRREKRWSTRAKDKKDGWRRSYTEECFVAAAAAYKGGEGTQTEIEQRFGLPIRTLSARGVKKRA